MYISTADVTGDDYINILIHNKLTIVFFVDNDVFFYNFKICKNRAKIQKFLQIVTFGIPTPFIRHSQLQNPSLQQTKRPPWSDACHHIRSLLKMQRMRLFHTACAHFLPKSSIFFHKISVLYYIINILLIFNRMIKLTHFC